MKLFHINKTYRKIKVLHVDQLLLKQGLAHGLLGANGAGKSTLIKVLVGLVYNDERKPISMGKVSMLPENPYLPQRLTAYQLVKHACAIQQQATSADDLLRLVCLRTSAWYQPIASYSKGMKQRTAIAYSLAGMPNWLILDEPMSGLDAMGRKQMLEVFMRKKEEGISILMCSHAVTDLVRLCDVVHIMAAGKVCESIEIQRHDMKEVEALEEKLVFWSKNNALD